MVRGRSYLVSYGVHITVGAVKALHRFGQGEGGIYLCQGNLLVYVRRSCGRSERGGLLGNGRSGRRRSSLAPEAEVVIELFGRGTMLS